MPNLLRISPLKTLMKLGHNDHIRIGIRIFIQRDVGGGGGVGVGVGDEWRDPIGSKCAKFSNY